MSAPKHTPGPWVVRHGVCRNDHPDTSADVHGPQGQFVADCGCHEQANANATLIAAGPRLVDALVGASGALKLVLNQLAQHEEGNVHADRALAAIDAALRAAGRLP